MVSSRHAFTVIELLVVIAIITVLSALIVASASAFGVGSKKEKTNAILAAIRNGLDLHAAQAGSRVAAAEHPAAGSRAPRRAFRRPDGAAVASTGLALVGVVPSQVRAADRAQVLGDEDRFVDTDLPLLYGLERREIGVLGARLATVTEARRLPPTITTADDPARFGTREAPTATPDRHAVVIDQVIDRAGLRAELLALNAMRVPEEAFTVPMWEGRLLSDVAAGAGAPQWSAGRVAHGANASGPTWAEYRLPGATLVDAWGREILYAIDAHGAVTLMSAGADGVFVIDPGPNGLIDTADPAAGPAGDDLDGRRDNLVSGQG